MDKIANQPTLATKETILMTKCNEDFTALAVKLMREADVQDYDWSLSYDERKRALSRWWQRTIKTAEPCDEETLAILAHEVGHVATTRFRPQFSPDIIKDEFEATKWGIENLRKYGFEPTKHMQTIMRNALATYVHFMLPENHPANAFLNGADL